MSLTSPILSGRHNQRRRQLTENLEFSDLSHSCCTCDSPRLKGGDECEGFCRHSLAISADAFLCSHARASIATGRFMAEKTNDRQTNRQHFRSCVKRRETVRQRRYKQCSYVTEVQRCILVLNIESINKHLPRKNER